MMSDTPLGLPFAACYLQRPHKAGKGSWGELDAVAAPQPCMGLRPLHCSRDALQEGA